MEVYLKLQIVEITASSLPAVCAAPSFAQYSTMAPRARGLLFGPLASHMPTPHPRACLPHTAMGVKAESAAGASAVTRPCIPPSTTISRRQGGNSSFLGMHYDVQRCPARQTPPVPRQGPALRLGSAGRNPGPSGDIMVPRRAAARVTFTFMLQWQPGSLRNLPQPHVPHGTVGPLHVPGEGSVAEQGVDGPVRVRTPGATPRHSYRYAPSNTRTPAAPCTHTHARTPVYHQMSPQRLQQAWVAHKLDHSVLILLVTLNKDQQGQSTATTKNEHKAWVNLGTQRGHGANLEQVTQVAQAVLLRRYVPAGCGSPGHSTRWLEAHQRPHGPAGSNKHAAADPTQRSHGSRASAEERSTKGPT
jgi:hypothetical protein